MLGCTATDLSASGSAIGKDGDYHIPDRPGTIPLVVR